MGQVVGLRFNWILSVEVVAQFKGVLQEFCRFPREFVVANPTDKVFKSFSNKFGVKYLFHLEFYVVVNNDREWGRLFLSSKRVVNYGFK